MTPEQIADLVRDLEHSAIRDDGVKSQANDLRWKAAKAIESLRADVANAERRAEDAEARNVFLETEIAALAEKVKK